jgi:holo-[acyl-carrier protein] synthase
MAVMGIGVDLLSVERMETAWLRHQHRLAQRILHEDELRQLPSGIGVGRWLAKRWAVKEAAAKALGTGFQQSVKLTDFSYAHDHLGKPILNLSGEAAKIAKETHRHLWHVSISDEKEQVIAMVIVEDGR